MALFLGACQKDCPDLSESQEQKTFPKERLRTIKKVDGGVSTRAVVEKEKSWTVGDTIKIKFLNGSTAIQEKVKLYAAQWLEYANLKFEYVSAGDNADVKIGFDLDTRFLAWSTIGMDCKAIPQNEPYLNFVWLEEDEDTFIKGEVLRSFGHVLGLGFEHRNPDSLIVFNGRAQAYS